MIRFCNKIFLFVIYIAILTGCTDISERSTQTGELSLSVPSVSNTISSPFITEEDIDAENIENNSESYSTYTFTENDEKFIGSLVFVGDSICMGLSSYGILAKSHVIAQGNVAVRNIMELKFADDSGGEFDVLTALVNAASEYIVLSMGMNDINITDADVFCNNYINLISMIKTYCPDTKIIVLSVTPVCESSDFTENNIINSYNSALDTYITELNNLNNYAVYYLNISPELINSAGYLKNKYTSGDGIHLTETAYYAILRQICDMGIHLG